MSNKVPLVNCVWMFHDKKFQKQILSVIRFHVNRFGKLVENRFHGNLENLREFYQEFIRLSRLCHYNRASANDAASFVIARNKINKWFHWSQAEEQQVNKRIRSDKLSGKASRLPRSVLEYILKENGFHITNHGKSFKSNLHHSRNVVPMYSKLDYIWRKYLLLRQKNKNVNSSKAKHMDSDELIAKRMKDIETYKLQKATSEKVKTQPAPSAEALVAQINLESL